MNVYIAYDDGQLIGVYDSLGGAKYALNHIDCGCDQDKGWAYDVDHWSRGYQDIDKHEVKA